MCRVVPHAKFGFDDPGDPIACPYVPSETHHLGTLAKNVQQAPELSFPEAGYRSGRFALPKRLAPTLDGAFDPLADRPLGHAEGFGNQALRPMLFLMEFPGPKTAQLSPILGFY